MAFYYLSFFGFLLFALSLGFLTIYFNKFNVGKLILTNTYIVIPERWKERTRINFNEIIEISEFDTSDMVIELVTSEEVFLVVKQWMNPKSFETVRLHLSTIL